MFPNGYKIVYTNCYNVIIFYPNCIISAIFEQIVPNERIHFCRFDADFCGLQVSVDVNRDVNRDVIMDVIMDVTDRFKPSYSTIFTLFDAITRKRQHDGAHLDRRKRYIQSGYRAENETFGTDFPRLEPKQPKQNSGIISNKSEPQKGNLTGAEQYCSERDGKHESDLNRRNAERQKNRRKAQKGHRTTHHHPGQTARSGRPDPS